MGIPQELLLVLRPWGAPLHLPGWVTEMRGAFPSPRFVVGVYFVTRPSLPGNRVGRMMRWGIVRIPHRLNFPKQNMNQPTELASINEPNLCRGLISNLGREVAPLTIQISDRSMHFCDRPEYLGPVICYYQPPGVRAGDEAALCPFARS